MIPTIIIGARTRYLLQNKIVSFYNCCSANAVRSGQVFIHRYDLHFYYFIHLYMHCTTGRARSGSKSRRLGSASGLLWWPTATTFSSSGTASGLLLCLRQHLLSNGSHATSTTAATSIHSAFHTMLYLFICNFSDLGLYYKSNIFNDPTWFVFCRYSCTPYKKFDCNKVLLYCSCNNYDFSL